MRSGWSDGFDRVQWITLAVVAAVVVLVASAPLSAATLEGRAADLGGEGLAGAIVELHRVAGGGGPSRWVTAGDDGAFHFSGLAAGSYTVVATAVGYEELRRSAIELAAEQVLRIELSLTRRGYHEEVEVAVPGRAAAAVAAVELGADILEALPLPGDRFQEALPLLPGVVRDRRGRLSFNGTRAGQNALLVNGGNVTDPLTGEFAFDLPVNAVDQVVVHSIPYSAEYGRVRGAVTSVVTRGGEDEWDLDTGNLWPSFRFRGGTIQGVESATPTVRVSGPLRRGKAWLSQSLGFRFVRARARDFSLPGEDEEVAEGYDSLTQLDFRTDRHLVTATVSLFPVEIDNLGIDTLHPELATPDLESSGLSLALSDRLTTSSDTVWETVLGVRRLDVSLRPKGDGPSRLTVEGLRDNYFNFQDRESAQMELDVSCVHLESGRLGPHVLKLGGNVYYSDFSGVDRSGPIELLTAAGELGQRTEFRGDGAVGAWGAGVAAYMQDRWRPSERLTLDLGLRYDWERITGSHHLSPRLAFTFAPWADGRTIIRGGWGLFRDEVPLHAGSFGRFQQRVETRFAADGAPLGEPLVFRNVVASEGLDVPRSNTWNLELDQALGDAWMLRFNYRERRDSHGLIVDRLADAASGPTLLLSSSGSSLARELDVTLRRVLPDDGELMLSFSKLRATGDLNDFAELYGNLRDPLLLANEAGPAPTDVPERVLAWGVVKLPWGITLSPAVEWRRGFPVTLFNEDYSVRGERGRGGRLPSLFSADVRVMKSLELFGYEMEVGVAVRNLTDHANPRDFQGNAASPSFGRYSNSVGRSIGLRFKLQL